MMSVVTNPAVFPQMSQYDRDHVLGRKSPSAVQRDALAKERRHKKVYSLWTRMPIGASDELWHKFNAVITRKFGKP